MGAILYLCFVYEPTLQRETEFDDVEDAANMASRLVTKKRFSAGADTLVGNVKASTDDTVVEAIDEGSAAGRQLGSMHRRFRRPFGFRQRGTRVRKRQTAHPPSS